MERKNMSYKIVVDSCCDLPDNWDDGGKVVKVPLTLHLDGVDYIDDETFNQKAFIKAVSESESCPKTSCPSPGAYCEAYDGEGEDIYVVTLSEKLSGSYGSAVVGMNLFLEEHEEQKKNIHVFNSCTASGGEGQIAMKIRECADQGKTFEEVVAEVEEFRYAMNTYFVIETLETLRKNGRLTGLQAMMASVLNIKPVMGASKEGEIIKLDQARGMERALKKMTEYVLKQVVDADKKTLVVTHCNCPERAGKVAKTFRETNQFKNVMITGTGGISTCYANDGGIIVTV